MLSVRETFRPGILAPIAGRIAEMLPEVLPRMRDPKFRVTDASDCHGEVWPDPGSSRTEIRRGVVAIPAVHVIDDQRPRRCGRGDV